MLSFVLRKDLPKQWCNQIAYTVAPQLMVLQSQVFSQDFLHDNLHHNRLTLYATQCDEMCDLCASQRSELFDGKNSLVDEVKLNENLIW